MLVDMQFGVRRHSLVVGHTGLLGSPPREAKLFSRTFFSHLDETFFP
jgi:hypothetical protein